MSESATTIDAPPPAWWWLGPGLWVAAALMLMTGYLFFSLPGGWFGGSPPQNYPGATLSVAAGVGQVADGRLVITSPDQKSAVILVLNTPRISTQKYRLIVFDVEGMHDDADATLFWRNDLAPNKMFTRSVSVVGGRMQDAMLAGDSNWLGHVHTIGLIVQGAMLQPMIVTGLALKPGSAADILSERWRDWIARETWTGVSLSRIVGGRAGMDLPLPLLAGLAVALATGGYWALRRWRRWPTSALTVAAIVMSGWLVLDLRWQWNLGLDAMASADKFSGKDLSSKRLAGIDAELEKIAIDVRSLLTQDVRLFVVAQAPVIAGRLAYLLLPVQVYYDVAQVSLPPPERFMKGDLLLIHRKSGVRYSPERKELVWSERFRMNADLLYAKNGTVLLRVT